MSDELLFHLLVKSQISPTYDDEGKIKSYIGIRTPITELMVMSGIEQACQDDEAGKPITPHLKKVIQDLKKGSYKVFDNA